MKPGIRAALMAAVTAAGVAGGWLLARGLEPLVHETDLRAALPPCFELGGPLHHGFRPGCTDLLETPRGPVPFSVNEDGLRDLARAQILKRTRRVLVLGDSYVEGWWAAAGQTLPAELNTRVPAAYFVNAGLRSTGPLLQAARLAALLPVYRPERVLWFLNDTDGADDRLACALLKDPAAPAEKLELGADDFALGGFPAWLAGHLGDSALGRRVRRASYQKAWADLVHGERAGRCGACRGVREVARIAREAKVPLLASYLPSGAGASGAVYDGEPSPQRQLLGCLAEAGVDVAPVDFSALPEAERRTLYWEGDFHLNPEGTMVVGEQLAPAVRRWLGEKR